MRDYVNTSDLTSTNSQIAKFCLDHPDLIHTCSLNKLSDVSYFSQPTLSRFFQHVCGLSFNDYAKKDLEQTHEVKKIVFSFGYISKLVTFSVKPQILLEIRAQNFVLLKEKIKV